MSLLARQVSNTNVQLSTLSNGIIANLSHEDGQWHFNGKPMTKQEYEALRSLFLFMDRLVDDARSALGFC